MKKIIAKRKILERQTNNTVITYLTGILNNLNTEAKELRNKIESIIKSSDVTLEDLQHQIFETNVSEDDIIKKNC